MDCFVSDVRVKKSNIQHADSRSGFFNAQSFGEQELLRFYYGSLVYVDLALESHMTELDRKSAIQMIVETL